MTGAINCPLQSAKRRSPQLPRTRPPAYQLPAAAAVQADVAGQDNEPSRDRGSREIRAEIFPLCCQARRVRLKLTL